MPKSFFCRRCGVDYSFEERNKSMFCIKCGTCLIDKSKIDPYYLRPTNQEAAISNIISLIDFKNVYLPNKYKQKLISAHQIGSQILRSAGQVPEPLETALTVEEYRWFWKPKIVKFVLVAESHVHATSEEIKVNMKSQRLPSTYPRNGPLNFAKIVYCLGYGDSSILDSPGKIENNPGTKQFLNLFKELIGINKQPRYKSKIEWRTHILNTVKNSGLWLLDASVHACYLGRGERLPNNVVKKIIPISWNSYVRPIIDDLDIDTSCVWIIGKGLHDLLKGKYVGESNWIYQPNARFSNKDKFEEKKMRKTKLKEAIKQCCSG